MKRWSLATLVIPALVWWTGCGADTEAGGQYIGQRCFSPQDCAPGLVCKARICVATTGIAPDGQDADMSVQDQGPTPDMGGEPDMIGPKDQGGPSCVLGQRVCLDTRTVEECVAAADGSPILRERVCADDLSCNQGRCVDSCVDSDNDGFFQNCEPRDCNDFSPQVSPSAPEQCDDRIDNNCDGRVDESCPIMGCCEGGCAEGTFCNQCTCTPFMPEVCQFQDQPCAFEGSFDNGFACADVFGSGQLRCVGICDRDAPSPDSTCPEANTVCAFNVDQSQGICLSSCSLGPGCGEPGHICLPFDQDQGDGICIPSTGTGMIGAPCDPEQAFSCGDGALCIEDPSSPNTGGRCTQACRPFQFGGMGSDCNAGAFCQPFSAEVGVCVRDNGFAQGDICRPFNTACGADAVGCFPTADGRQRCQRLCRIDQGNADCGAAQSCRRFSQDQDDIGVCTRNAP